MEVELFSKRRLLGLAASVALSTFLLFCHFAAAGGPENIRTVVVLYPNAADGSPGQGLVDESIRSTFAAASPERVEIHNEYLDLSRFRDAGYRRLQVDFLRRKYAGRTVDLVIAGLATVLDFMLEHRDEVFPGVPIVFVAVDQREVKDRNLAPDVIGVPIKFDLAATLDLALRLHPGTRRVFVVAGRAKFDAYWEAEARQAFRPYEDKLELAYLSGLPMEDLLKRVADLPERSIVYYLHVFQDGAGKAFVPAYALELLAARANAPIYGHVDGYVGRGIVGGRVIRFEAEGENAARLGLRILAGEKPENIGVQETSANTYMFDWRQLRRWGISGESLPPGSIVRYKEPSFWDLYRWRIIGVLALCVIQGLLIAGLLAQRAHRRRAEEGLRQSQRELRGLTGRLLQAHETESRRIARELHDDLNQNLALLSVEMDLLGQKPPESPARLRGRMQELSARVKHLSSSVHALSYRLHPSKLEQLGLVAAVSDLCKELNQIHGLPIEFTHDPLPAVIPQDTALCLYRIAQEALRNVIKHSGARHAAVKLSGSADAICLRIVDDGVGFDPALVEATAGLGLVSMRERVRLVGGEIAIDSRPSGGTRIDVRVPLGPSGQAKGALQPQATAI